MKIFAVRDEEMPVQKDLAYLFYYEQERRFYIELPEDADEWDTPLLLSSFVKRGERTLDAYWSKLWVEQRIVPKDRQNLGQILKENHLSEYDEFSLLMLSEGRCAQDSCYLTPISPGELPDDFAGRYAKRVEDVVPLAGFCLLIFFRDGLVRKCDAKILLKDVRSCHPVLKDETVFCSVNVLTDGYGICWGESLSIDNRTLYGSGDVVPLALEDFRRFISYRTADTAEAAELLDCSRKEVGDLALRGELHPVKTDEEDMIFLKSEIMRRLWK